MDFTFPISVRDPMNVTGLHNAWFAIQVAPRREKTVAAILKVKGYEHLLPTYRPKGRTENRAALPLFPGYVFCRMDVEVRAPIVSTPGVVRIVGCGKQPACLAEHEVEALRTVAGSGCYAQPRRFLHSGETVRISDGPLRGIVGIVADSGEGLRLVLSITLLQRSISVEVEQGWLTPLDANNPAKYRKAIETWSHGS